MLKQNVFCIFCLVTILGTSLHWKVYCWHRHRGQDVTACVNNTGKIWPLVSTTPARSDRLCQQHRQDLTACVNNTGGGANDTGGAPWVLKLEMALLEASGPEGKMIHEKNHIKISRHCPFKAFWNLSSSLGIINLMVLCINSWRNHTTIHWMVEPHTSSTFINMYIHKCCSVMYLFSKYDIMQFEQKLSENCC